MTFNRDTSLRIIAAVSVFASGALHFDLWRQVYRHAPVREIFLLNAFGALVVAVAMLVRVPKVRRLVPFAGLGISAGSLGAFILSRNGGVPTLHGNFTEAGLQPDNITLFGVRYAILVLIFETLALLTSTVLVVIEFKQQRANS